MGDEDSGFFDYSLVEGFMQCEDLDNDGWVSASEVFDYAKPRTEEILGGIQHPVNFYDIADGRIPLAKRDVTKPFPDLPPIITILSPQNLTYMTRTVSSISIIDEPTYWMGYCLDGQSNVTIDENTTLTDLSEGTHTILVYSNDTLGNMGKSIKVFFTVYIPIPPVASFTWIPYSPTVGDSITFNASYSTPNGGVIIAYEWDFGDGEYAGGKVITHVYSDFGTYIVTLNVSDSEGLWGITQMQIEVHPFTGDLNKDNVVDMRDISIVCKAFGSFPGRADWNSEADLDKNDRIDLRDIGIVCLNFWKHSP